MERYFVFLLVHDSANQEDCQCHKNVIPALQSLVKDLLEFYNQEKTTPRDLKNSQYELFDPFLALEGSVPSIYFSILEDKLFLHQFEFYSKWCKGQHLEEVSRVLNKTMSCQNKQPDEMSSDEHADISERLHGLADDLPDHVGVPVDVFWFMCGKNNMPVRSHLNLFGALKRLQQWHNANITVLCSNEFDRTTFLSSWQKALNISVRQLNTNDVASRLFNPSVIWQGSLVFNEDQSRIRLPSFNLCCSGQSKKNIQLLLKTCVQEKTSTEVGHSGLCIAPGIDVLCKVKKHTVPFHMFVPVKLNLSVACYSAKLSARLVEWLSSGNNKDIALIGSLKVVRRPSTQCLKEKNKEAWFNFVTAQNHSETMANSKAEDDDADSSRRLCLICGDTKKQLSLFVLRAPEHLNGRLQHDLAVVHSTLSISKDQEVGGPLRFPDLTDSFLETEQKLTEVLLSRLQQELSNSNEPCTINPTTEFVDQLISAKWKLLKEEREQLLRNGKEHELEVVRRETFLHATSDLSMSPSRWPERAWLIKNDPNTTVKSATAGDMTKQFPLVTSVSSLSVQDILEKFRLDGCPVTCDLSPVKLREQSLADRHIQINTTRSVEDVKGERYPEALAASYHGIEYCLDDRDAIAKDSQLAFLQSSHVKLETLSSCVQRDHKPVENRPARAVTKTAKNVDKKQHLMKLSVPLVRTKATGKGKTPAVIGRPLKRKSPVLKKPDTAVKRKREEPAVEETTSSRIKNATKKETRSERHKRRLRQVVQKALEDSGIDSNHEFYEPCTERLYSLCKSFLKDLRSSHGLNDEMKRLANSNVQQVIEFETKRT